MLGFHTIAKVIGEVGLRYAELGARHDPQAKRIVSLLRDPDSKRRGYGLKSLEQLGTVSEMFLPRLVTMVVGSYLGGPFANDRSDLATTIIGRSGLVGLRMLLRQLSPGKDGESAGAAFRAIVNILDDRVVVQQVGRDGIVQLMEQADRYLRKFGPLRRPHVGSDRYDTRCRVATYVSVLRQLLDTRRTSLEVGDMS